MWNNLARALFVAVLLAGAAAVYFYHHYAQLQEALTQLRADNEALAHELERYKEHVVYLTGRLEEDIARLSKEQEQELARLRQTHEDMVQSLEKEIQAGQVRITRLADRLSVNIVDRILFPSGEAEITREGREVLARVARVLAQSRDHFVANEPGSRSARAPRPARGRPLGWSPYRVIRIEGHTDNVPIHKHLQNRFATNWELSAARATNVVRFLQQHSGLPPSAFEAVGLGEYHPVADNATATGRAQNRRIEIILYPRVQALAQELPAPEESPSR